MKTSIALKLTSIFIFSVIANLCEAHAGSINLDGMKIRLNYLRAKHLRVDGATCVDAANKKYAVTACFIEKEFIEAAKLNGFFEYEKLDAEAQGMVGEQPLTSLVYGGGNWMYPTQKQTVGDFVVYESSDVLCHDSPPLNQNSSGICYFSALRSTQNTKNQISIFLSAKINKNGKKNDQIQWIHKFIQSITIVP